MLEPTGDDSFFAWNFFDAILQQKEGYSDYRWEDVAANYLQTDTALKLNGVAIQQLKRDTTILVNIYKIESYKSRTNPYEKHHGNYVVKTSEKKDTIHFLRGDNIIYMNQIANRYIVEMLEPTGDDSFFAWNFFDAILQQKEGYSDYRWEDVAASYLKTNEALKQKLEDKKKSDAVFANDSRLILDFIYKNSPYYEPMHMRYPIFRINY